MQPLLIIHFHLISDPHLSLSLFQLLLHVDAGALPQDLGGALDYDHLDWLAKCNQVAEAQVGSRHILSILFHCKILFLHKLLFEQNCIKIRKAFRSLGVAALSRRTCEHSRFLLYIHSMHGRTFRKIFS